MNLLGKRFVTVTRLRMVTDPIFFPHKEHHKRLTIVRALKAIVDSNHIIRYPLKPITLMFWGEQAAKAALLLKAKGSVVDVVGTFRMFTSFRNGKLHPNLHFNVADCDFREETLEWFCNEFREFTMEEVNKTGKFGNAWVWIRGQGFVVQPTAAA
jgi:hypothetical protein